MLSRRGFIRLSVAGALGAGAYGLSCGVQKVRDTAKSLSEL